MRPVPFAVSEFTTWHQSLEDDVALFARLGVPTLELCERKLSVDPADARRQLALAAEHGIAVSTVQPRVHALFPDTLSPLPVDPAERMGRYRATVDLVAGAVPDRPLTLVTIGGAAPGYDFRRAWSTAVTEYRRLAGYAADRGVRIAFEPLHPILMNVDTFVCTLTGAVELCEAVDSPAFGLMVDTWHVWQEPAIADRLAGLGERIFGVQVSDYPAAGPRALADRLVPGDGVTDLAALVAATLAAGYRGPYCLEIFSDDALPDSLWRADPADVITRGRDELQRIWDRVGGVD